MPAYDKAGCAAIKKDGVRCGRRWGCALPCTFEYDPTTQEGTKGPWIVLCAIHKNVYHNRRELWRAGKLSTEQKRIELVHGGWLGLTEPYKFYDRVFAGPTGDKVVRWWWERRSDIKVVSTEAP